MIDWAQLYRETYADLVRYLHRKVWDGERARDLAQEVFSRALQHDAARGADPERPRAWLFTIAANLARDEARSMLRRKRHLVLLQGEAAAHPGEAPDAALERAEQERAARLALEQLSERDREVLLLWDAGLSYPDIAAHTGLAPGAIGTTLARARRRLVEAHELLEAKHVARG
ncbi:MAG TPA: sigma-70 family RNA polymerase sigma factor [Longimicrobiales bacterium]|nr:sigma-70 family RNA polymerase sigma factor [Longimicrobiales bacterium]